jgi:hypothetical protein
MPTYEAPTPHRTTSSVNSKSSATDTNRVSMPHRPRINLQFCDCSDSSNKLILLFNATTHQIAVVNASASTIYVVDAEAGLAALYAVHSNGGVVVVVNLRDGTGAYADGSSWTRNQTIADFPSLRPVYEEARLRGKTFNSSSPPDEILKSVSTIWSSLSRDTCPSSNALVNFIRVSNGFLSLLNGPLKGLPGYAGNIHVAIPGDVNRLLGVHQGLATMIHPIDGGISTLRNRHVRLDFANIFSESNPIRILIYIIQQLFPANLLSNLISLLSIPLRLLLLLVKLAGSVLFGIGGFFNALLATFTLSLGRSTPDSFITTLVNYFGNDRSDTIQPHQWSASLTDLQSTFQTCHLTHSLGPVPGLLTQITNNNWTQNSIPLSPIVSNLLQNNHPDRLQTIVTILFSLHERFAPQNLICRLFLALISLTRSPGGLPVLTTLVPNIITSNLVGTGGLQHILPGLDPVSNFPEHIANIFDTMGDFWQHIPVVGIIFEALDRAIAQVSRQMNLVHLLNTDEARSCLEQILESLRRASDGLDFGQEGGHCSGIVIDGGNEENKMENAKQRNRGEHVKGVNF